MIAFVFLTFFTSFYLNARPYNYQDLPIGHRTASMGSAGIAVPDDLAAVINNPAMMSFQKETQISASMSSYTKVDVRNGNHVNLFSSAKDNLSEKTFRAIPTMVGGSLNTKGYSWGGGIFIPRFFQIEGTLDENSGNTASFTARDESVWIAAFIANKFKRTAWGATLAYVSVNNTENFSYITGTSTTQFQLTERSLETNAIVGILGLGYDLDSKWRVGMSFRTPFLVIGGKGSSLSATDTDANRAPQVYEAENFSEPMRLSLGVSYTASKRWLFALDLHGYTQQRYNLTNTQDLPYQMDAKPIINFAVGSEYWVWKYLMLRAGVFSNFSSARNVPSYSTAINDKVNLMGGSAALVIKRDTGEVSLGGYLMAGQGHVPDILSNNTGTAIPRSVYFYGFTIASTFRF